MVRERVVYHNGELVPQSQAKVHFLDSGFLDGDAAFDRTRTFGGQIFRLKDHLRRLYDSLKYMRIDPNLTLEQMCSVTMDVLEANLPLLEENGDYWVTQRVTRGVPEDDGSLQPTVIVDCMPIPFAGRARYYRDGIPVITPSIRRTAPVSLSPRAKVNNCVNTVLAELEVGSQNSDAWPVLLDINGNLAEGGSSNFFVVRNGVVVTPRVQYVLGGISRLTVLELAREIGVETREANLDLFDAYTADEAFLTSTSLCLCPVSSVNGSSLGAGSVPGPVTARLQEAYSRLVGIDIVDQYLSRLS